MGNWSQASTRNIEKHRKTAKNIERNIEKHRKTSKNIDSLNGAKPPLNRP